MLKSPVVSLLFARQWATPQVSSAEKPSFALITHEELQLKFQRSYVIFFSLFLVGKTNDQTCLMTISVMDIERLDVLQQDKLKRLSVCIIIWNMYSECMAL